MLALQDMAEDQAAKAKAYPYFKPMLLSRLLTSSWPKRVTWLSPHHSGLGNQTLPAPEGSHRCIIPSQEGMTA